MSTLRYSDGEYLAGSAIREMLEAVSDELVRRGHPAITVTSGTRLYSTQERIFRERYVPVGMVGGRPVYDYQTWNGATWARISPAGRVAPPSQSAPHVANIAADLGSPYNAYGSARSAMLQVIDDLELDGQLVNTGTGFGEVWHWESRRGAGVVGRPASSTGQSEEDELMGAKEDIENKIDASRDRPVQIIKVGDAWLMVDHGAGTRWNLARGQSNPAEAIKYKDWLVSTGIEQYDANAQPGFVAAAVRGYRDIT